MFDRSALAAAVAAHGRVTRVVVVSHQGSTPRETGTSMLVWDGGQSGTIGGGALEWEAARAARASTAPQVIRMPLGPALGQCCGGAVTLVLEPFDRATLPPPAQEIYSRRITGTAPAPHRTGRTDRTDGGREVLIWRDGWLTEPAADPATPVWIFGAGHVGREIVRALDQLPFAVTWVDTATDRFPRDIPDGVTCLPASAPAEAARHAPDAARHLILTHSHTLDLEICHALLSRPAAFVGLIGSATKRARFRSRLTRLGHDAQTLDRLVCPIGDRSLGKHPKGIALGVAVQLVQSAGRDTRDSETR